MRLSNEDDKHVHGSIAGAMQGLCEDLNRHIIGKDGGPAADEIYEYVRNFLAMHWDLLPVHKELSLERHTQEESVDVWFGFGRTMGEGEGARYADRLLQGKDVPGPGYDTPERIANRVWECNARCPVKTVADMLKITAPSNVERYRDGFKEGACEALSNGHVLKVLNSKGKEGK